MGVDFPLAVLMIMNVLRLFKSMQPGRRDGLTPVIPALWEVEMGRSPEVRISIPA